jgi:hypothetical protein
MRAELGCRVALLAALVVSFSSAGADVITLQDVNAEADIDLGSPAGFVNWRVDGTDHLRKQWFWYRVGDRPEQSLDTLTLDKYKASDGDTDIGEERLIALYLGTGFSVMVDFILTGGPAGSGASDLMEVITLQNTGQETLDFHFFQYVDLELRGDSQDQSAEIRAGNTAVQKDVYSALSETVVTWCPDRYEVAFYDDILDKLTDADADDLSNVAGPLGPGDLTWAFQWDVQLRPGDTFIISKDKNLVPEPTCLALLGMGALGLVIRRRR